MTYNPRLALILVSLAAAQVAFGEMTVNIGGRIQVDAALYDEDTVALGSGTEFRRARLFASGDIQEDWGYKLQLDFADSSLEMKDAFIVYRGLRAGALKIGQFKTPLNLEELTSSKYITFMERSLPNTLATSHRIGVGYERNAGASHLAAAIYGNSASDVSGDEGIGVGARYAYAPQLNDHSFIHLGAAVAYEEPTNTDGGSDSLRYRARPESHVTSTRLVDTGNIANISSVTKAGLELAYVSRGFSAQAEYLMSGIDAAGGDADFAGYYAYVSYFPGGTGRSYKDGVFQRTKVSKAWEFAARFSHIDLSDGPIAGGEQDDITLAANYYVSPYLRFMANYILVDAKVAGVSEKPKVFQVRAAMDFK